MKSFALQHISSKSSSRSRAIRDSSKRNSIDDYDSEDDFDRSFDAFSAKLSKKLRLNQSIGGISEKKSPIRDKEGDGSGPSYVKQANILNNKLQNQNTRKNMRRSSTLKKPDEQQRQTFLRLQTNVPSNQIAQDFIVE